MDLSSLIEKQAMLAEHLIAQAYTHGGGAHSRDHAIAASMAVDKLTSLLYAQQQTQERNENR